MVSDGSLGRGGSAVKRTPEEPGREEGKKKEGEKERGKREEGKRKEGEKERRGGRRSLKVVFCSLNMSNNEIRQH